MAAACPSLIVAGRLIISLLSSNVLNACSNFLNYYTTFFCKNQLISSDARWLHLSRGAFIETGKNSLEVDSQCRKNVEKHAENPHFIGGLRCFAKQIPYLSDAMLPHTYTNACIDTHQLHKNLFFAELFCVFSYTFRPFYHALTFISSADAKRKDAGQAPTSDRGTNLAHSHNHFLFARSPTEGRLRASGPCQAASVPPRRAGQSDRAGRGGADGQASEKRAGTRGGKKARGMRRKTGNFERNRRGVLRHPPRVTCDM